MSKQKYALLVVAHPDDESIFFAGLLMNERSRPWKVICVTDGNADQMGNTRANQFKEACRLLKVKCEHWDFEDKFEKRLNIKDLVERLRSLEKPEVVYTHGILGEYGHPHHQDVSYAVHEAFNKKVTVWSPAYNRFPQKKFVLSKKQYNIKTKIITKIYHSETLRFLNFLPLTFSEGYVQTPFNEIKHIYSYFTGGRVPPKSKLKTYAHLYEYLKERRSLLPTRPF